MNRYYLVVVGDNICLERGADIPIAGFVAPRCIRACDEQHAVQTVKIELLKAWKHNFNRDNKAGTPRLDVAQIERIKNPLKRLQHGSEFFFYGIEEERATLLATACRASRRWFRMR
ncbi:MAG: hypothetical protein HKO71_00955 [Pseudomonadales bacterium]|nr:hypothetical protein [Gammaproteobacteria bacterium]NNL56294.1 hypothetical protein [Pseudomonadales bacterium]